MAIAYVSNAVSVTGANSTLTLAATAPATITNGNLLLAVVACGNNTAPTISGPAGWTKITGASGFDAGSPGNALEVWYKIAAGESGTYTFTTSATSTRMRVHIHNYSGTDATTPVGSAAFAVNSSSTTTRVTGSVTAAGGEWVVAAYSDEALSSYTQSGSILERTDAATSNTSLSTGDTNGTVSAGSKSYTATATGANTTASASILLVNPAGSSPPTLNFTPIGNTGGAITIDATASSAGVGGALSISISPSGTVHTSGDPLFQTIEADPTSMVTYTITLSEVGGSTDTATIDVQPQTSGTTSVDIVAPDAWDGTNWV
jgi:hypothetical protein